MHNAAVAVASAGRVAVAKCAVDTASRSERDDAAVARPADAAPLSDAFFDMARRGGYAPATKTGQPAIAAASVGFWVAVLTFFATPPGLAALMLGVHGCTGGLSRETITARPWQSLALAAAGMAAASIAAFLPLALTYDRLYAEQPGLRCQQRRTHDVSGLLRRSEVRLAMANLAQAAFITCAVGILHIAAPGGRVYDRVYLETPTSPAAWAYLFASGVLFFIWTDAAAFAVHRLLHLPWLYRHVHKWHHAHVQPTAFASLALHPCEMLLMQTGVFLGLFLFPLHPAAVLATLLYIHVYNVIDHSGVYLESWLPWQPTTLYHDDHHRFFHVNYGQSLMWWDRMLGTLYTPRRKYGEAAFFQAR